MTIHRHPWHPRLSGAWRARSRQLEHDAHVDGAGEVESAADGPGGGERPVDAAGLGHVVSEAGRAAADDPVRCSAASSSAVTPTPAGPPRCVGRAVVRVAGTTARSGGERMGHAGEPLGTDDRVGAPPPSSRGRSSARRGRRRRRGRPARRSTPAACSIESTSFWLSGAHQAPKPGVEQVGAVRAPGHGVERRDRATRRVDPSGRATAATQRQGRLGRQPTARALRRRTTP